MSRLTEKILKDKLDDFSCDHYKIMNEDYEDACIYKLGQLEDIEEEIGFEKSGSSLIAFLDTPYIKSIMKLYVSARKELENDPRFDR